MSKSTNGFRNEIKILLSYADYIDLKNKLIHLTEKDRYSGEDGEYFIRSLYFDDLYKSSYFNKIEGIDDRTKYRIRIYNNLDSVIKLESKSKKNNKIQKVSCTISKDIYNDILSGNYESLKEVDHPLAKTFYSLLKSDGYAPSSITDYDREAFVHRLSNTRLTFDKNLRAGISSYDIFDDDLVTLLIFQNNSVIFEVKYDEFIPSYLSDIIKTVRGSRMSLSKYCMCREKLMEVKIYE